MICNTHHFKRPEINEEPCIYCERDKLRADMDQLVNESITKNVDLKEAIFQIDDLKETEAELRGEITKYQVVNADANRLNGALREALDGFIDEECHCKNEEVVAPCVQCVARAALSGKSLKRECLHPKSLTCSKCEVK